jgi:hypothetical protein
LFFRFPTCNGPGLEILESDLDGMKHLIDNKEQQLFWG